MSKSIKFKNNTYLSTKGIVHNRKVLAEILYPVGSIYLSVNNVNPEVLYGGKWEQIKDVFLMAGGDSHKPGSTGGSENHSHTTKDFTLGSEHIPAHTHGSKKLVGKIQFRAMTNNSNIADTYNTGNEICQMEYDGGNTWSAGLDYTINSNKPTDVITINATHEHDSVGGGKAHNHGNTDNASNLPPFYAIYAWKRIE